MIRDSVKRMHETGAVSRTLLKGLARGGLLVADADLRVVSVEGDIYRGGVGAAMLGRRLADVVPYERWEVLRPHYRSALRGERGYVELKIPEQGTTVALWITPVRENGAVVGVMVFSRDITEETSTKAALAVGERRHSAVLEALDEGVIVTDLDLRLLDANATACSILAIDHVDAARGDPGWWESLAARLSGETDSFDPAGVIEEVLATGHGLRKVATELTRADEEPVALSMNFLAWRDESGAVAGLVISFRDVTISRREHRRLVETEKHLRQAHEVARLASWQWDPDSDNVRVFHALKDDESHSGAVVALEDLLKTLPESARQTARGELAELMSGTRDESVRRFCEQLPAGPRWIELRGRAERNADGQFVCVRGTSQDVTAEELAAHGIASARDFFQATLDSLPARVAVLTESGEIMRTNRAWTQVEPSERAAFGDVGDNYFEGCEAAPCEELATDAVAGLRAIAAGELQEISVEYPSLRATADGRFVFRAARYEGPGPARIVVSHDDVTPLHRVQMKSETQAALLDAVDVAVVATDAERRITHWNSGAERLLGWTRAEAVGRTTSGLSVGHDERQAEALEALRGGGRWEGESVLPRKDDTTFRADVRARLLRDGEGAAVGTIAVFVDATERIASERDLRSARDYMRAVADSMVDGLCTLDNEGRIFYVNPRAEELLGWSAAELVGRDLHEALHHTRADGSPYPAEECPLVAARLTRSAARLDDDALVGRAGTLLPVQLAQTPFETEDGVGGFVVVFSDISERKRREDHADRKLHDLAWIERIRDALDEDRLVLYAQPIVEIDSGRVVQHELLIRMLDHDGTAIAPGLFLPVAESYGSIGEIDRWVTRQSVKLAAEGHAVEINVSAQSLSDPTFYDYVELQLRRSDVDPALLVFELTETAIVRDRAATENFATRIHGLGCKLALDDFGTGYGGFTYLKQFPIDFLKIDIEFVRDLATDPASRHVVEAVVALARGFDLQIVAEGVEDAATLEILREYGVHYAQGYHLGRPAPLEQTFDSARPPT